MKTTLLKNLRRSTALASMLLLIGLMAPMAMNAQTTQLVQVTSLEVGETYVITCGSYAVGNTVYFTNNHMITSVSFSASDTPSTSIQYTIESGDATNGYIFKNVDNDKYIGYTSDGYLSLVEEEDGTPHKYDGTDLSNSVDSEGYYYVSLATSSQYNNEYFTTSTVSQTSNPIVIYKVVTGGDVYVWAETTTITPDEKYLIGFVNNGNVYLAVNYAASESNHYYTSVSSNYYGYTAQASFDDNGYVTGVSGYATDLQYCTWKFSETTGGTIQSGFQSGYYLRTYSSTTYADLYPANNSENGTGWTYASGKLYRTVSSTPRYAIYTTQNNNPHMCVTSTNPSSANVKLYTKQLVETGYAVNASSSISNGSIQFSINDGYDWYDNLSNVPAGETVIISVEPAAGYQLSGTPTVAPTSGTAPTVSGSGNQYSFEMPESDVTVNASFNCTTPANPTFSVATGTYTSAQTVSISCTTPGATIYYTTDGSTPTSSSTQYTGAITINSTTTLKAIAYNGSCTSNVTTATYTINLPSYTVTCATGLMGGSISASPTSAVEGTTITITATPGSGYFLGTITATDGNNNDVAVTVSDNEGTFTMPASNVNVTATFTQVFHVTLNQTPNGTISADQTTNLQPGDIVTLTATPDNDCVFLAWYAYKDGDPRDVIAVVNNSWFYMPSSDVTVQAVFMTEEEYEQPVGGGTSTSACLPTYNYFKYSLTEQIYTAAEIGYNGRITAIAFKADRSASRTLDIYMAHTEKTSFSSKTDWQTMGSAALVFTGSVSFVNGWTTITLDTPFEYDGTSNLNLCVADRTNSYVSSSGDAILFSTYATNENRALYIYNDDTDYGASVGFSNSVSDFEGTLNQTNDQIKITIKVPGSAESLTVSPSTITDFSYEEGQGPSQTHKLDIVGVDLENNITITAPTNFEICLTEDGTYSNSLTIPRTSGSKGNRTVTTWDFEDGLQSWTPYDVDDDKYTWEHDDTEDGGHNASDGCVASYSYDNDGGTLTPNNWLVSPQVTLGGTFSLWALAQDQAWPQEHFGIYVSTDGETFTMLNEWTLSAGGWKQYSVDLSAYAGQSGYIAVRHFNCTDQFAIKVDDFVLDPDAHITIEMPVTVTAATAFVRMKSNLTRNTYSGTLAASAGSGTNVNGSVSLSGEVLAPSYYISLAPNPFDGGEVIGEGSYTDGTEITVTATKRGNYTFINWTENSTVVSTNASYTFTVTGNRNLVANFVPTHTLTWAQPTGGIITVSQNDNVLTSPATVAQGSTLNITAAASTGYTFNGWTFIGTGASVADASNASTTLTMGSAATTLTASFTLNQHTVTYQYTGTVPSGAPAVPAQATYYYGTAVPAADVPTLAGYTFSGWVGEVSTMPDQDVTVTGSWTAIDYTLTLVADPTEGGTVSASPAGPYHYGDVVTITATANTGYTFGSWSDSGAQSHTVTITGNASYTANFTLKYNTWVDEVSTNPGTAHFEVASGGTNVYNVTIKSAQGLAYLISYVNGYDPEHVPNTSDVVNVTLDADLDMSEHVWVPIGDEDLPYKGTFNGNNHTISGLHIDDADEVVAASNPTNIGLFGITASGAMVKNLYVVDANFFGNTGNIGGIVGTNGEGSTVQNCFSSATLSGSAPNKGGLVGANSGTLSHSYTMASSVTGSGTSTKCYYKRTASGTPDNGEFTSAVAYTYGDYTTNNAANDGSTIKPLVDWLNTDNPDENVKWIRPKGSSVINGGYPVLVEVSSGGSKTGEALAVAASSGSKAVYYGTAASLISTYSSTPNTHIYVYGNGDLGSTAPNTTNETLFIDENASVISTNTNMRATVGITIDNSKHTNNGTTLLGRDWHCFATPLKGVSLGINYTNYIDPVTGEIAPIPYGADSATVHSLMTFNGGYFPDAYGLNAHKSEFDFYDFSEPDYHWINLKRNPDSHFHEDGNHNGITYTTDGNLKSGNGYLLAIGDATAANREFYLSATGVLNNDATVTAPVTNTTTAGHHLDGYNFLGNPFQSYLDFNRFASENEKILWDESDESEKSDHSFGYMAYMIYNADREGFEEYLVGPDGKTFSQEAASTSASTHQYIHPHQAFFVVKRTSGNDNVSFTTAMRNTAPTTSSAYRDMEELHYPLVNLFCTDEDGKEEISVIEFDRPAAAGSLKMKEMLGGKGNMYIRWNNEDFKSMFLTNTPDFVPVWFKSTEEGVFTMSWSTANDNFGYLHLIDNLTGNDIDMLATDSYAFQSKPSDSKARFRLVFKPLGIEEETSTEAGENFAFINGNELVVTGEGELSLIDLNGRILATEYVSGQQSHITMPRVAVGMYMLRLTNNKDVKVQKIVVRK